MKNKKIYERPMCDATLVFPDMVAAPEQDSWDTEPMNAKGEIFDDDDDNLPASKNIWNTWDE